MDDNFLIRQNTLTPIGVTSPLFGVAPVKSSEMPLTDSLKAIVKSQPLHMSEAISIPPSATTPAAQVAHLPQGEPLHEAVVISLALAASSETSDHPTSRGEALSEKFMSALFLGKEAHETDRFLGGHNMTFENALNRHMQYPERFLYRYGDLFQTKEQLVEFLTFVKSGLTQIESTSSNFSGLNYAELKSAVQSISGDFAQKERAATSESAITQGAATPEEVHLSDVPTQDVTIGMYQFDDNDEPATPQTQYADHDILAAHETAIEQENVNKEFFAFLNGNEDKAKDFVFTHIFPNTKPDDLVLTGEDTRALKVFEKSKNRISEDPSSPDHFSHLGCQSKEQAIKLIEVFKDCFENHKVSEVRKHTTAVANAMNQLEQLGLPAEEPPFPGITISDLQLLATVFIERLKEGRTKYREVIALPTTEQANLMRLRASQEGFIRDDVFTPEQIEEAISKYIEVVKFRLGIATNFIAPQITPSEELKSDDKNTNRQQLLTDAQRYLAGNKEYGKLAREFAQKIIDESKEKMAEDQREAIETKIKNADKERNFLNQIQKKEKETPPRVA